MYVALGYIDLSIWVYNFNIDGLLALVPDRFLPGIVWFVKICDPDAFCFVWSLMIFNYLLFW